MTRWRDDVAGLEATIIMHPKIWEASGHATTFADPMTDCLLTKKRFRADQIDPQSGVVYHFPRGRDATPASAGKQCDDPYAVLVTAGKTPGQRAQDRPTVLPGARHRRIRNLLGERTEKVENSTRYNPENGSLLTEPRQFNLMFKTYVGPVESAENLAWLRPETAQAIFAQFKNVLEVSRQKVPFGICQIGKAFRNEINPRNFTFRSREFEQMELEFFIRPDEAVEAICGHVATPGGPGPSRRAAARLGLADLAPVLGGGAPAFLRKHRAAPRQPGGILAKAGGTGPLRPRHRGYSLQVPLQQTRRQRRIGGRGIGGDRRPQRF